MDSVAAMQKFLLSFLPRSFGTIDCCSITPLLLSLSRNAKLVKAGNIYLCGYRKIHPEQDLVIRLDLRERFRNFNLSLVTRGFQTHFEFWDRIMKWTASGKGLPVERCRNARRWLKVPVQ